MSEPESSKAYVLAEEAKVRMLATDPPTNPHSMLSHE